MSHFSHTYLQRIIRDRIRDRHDLIVEGGIGVNSARYSYFREHGYNGHYVAVDLDPDLLSRIVIPPGLHVVIGDCFDYKLLATILRDTSAKKPLFFSYGSLCDCLLTGQYENLALPIDAVSEFYQTQFHMRPIVSGVEIYHPRMHRNGDVSNENFMKFQKFVKLSTQRWETEIISKNLILMEKR